MGRYRNGAGHLEPNARSVLIESPTGSGKTCMGWLVAKCMQQEISDLAVGWVSMRRPLLHQAALENMEKQIGVKNVHMISMFNKNPSELKKSGRKVLLVVDEAQHDAASSMAHLHNIIEPDYILGLSATPFRTDRVKLCFDKVLKDAGIHQLIQDEYLSKYDHYTVPNWNVETVTETYLREPKRWGKSLFYFVNLEQCYQCHRILCDNGIAADVVTSHTDIDAQLSSFESGETKVLINCAKLTEGFNAPDLQTVFVRDSGKGCTIQMAGRVFRKHDNIRTKQVVQSKLTRWPMIRTALPEQQYIWQENAWLSLTVNPKLSLINKNARLAIASVEVELPKFITMPKQRRRFRARR